MEVEDSEIIQDLFHNPSYCLSKLLDELDIFFTFNSKQVESNNKLVDSELLEEIEEYLNNSKIHVYFGNTLRDIRCDIQDENERKHEILIYYEGPKKLHVTRAEMPCSHLIQHNYSSLGDIIRAYKTRINELSSYFYQLEQLDQLCAVMEPSNPTFGDDYRRIYLDDRTWLHVEVRPDGLATNIRLIGNTEEWHNKLQAGFLLWDHDKYIVENILAIFELPGFSFPTRNPSREAEEISGPTCSICLCIELPDTSGLPQPLCKNYGCGVFFHRNCLYQWLIACTGNHQPDFGVATGLCPSCFQPITCREKDT